MEESMNIDGLKFENTLKQDERVGILWQMENAVTPFGYRKKKIIYERKISDFSYGITDQEWNDLFNVALHYLYTVEGIAQNPSFQAVIHGQYSSNRRRFFSLFRFLNVDVIPCDSVFDRKFSRQWVKSYII
jgi:hypothetical protein